MPASKTVLELRCDRNGDAWVSRRLTTNGVVIPMLTPARAGWFKESPRRVTSHQIHNHHRGCG
ncbi:MAG: hypothetical protein JWP83_5306 [Mycobacterium sp.]|jgi:hypothetical protein|nr:hypothetical protein [Mycobacterium sp.]